MKAVSGLVKDSSDSEPESDVSPQKSRTPREGHSPGHEVLTGCMSQAHWACSAYKALSLAQGLPLLRAWTRASGGVKYKW